MKIEPLPKRLYEALKKAGVDKLIIGLSGGFDEGYLEVSSVAETTDNGVSSVNLPGELAADIESWVWSAYDYTGAGDGSDYGDDIEYDLKNGKASHQEWYMQPAFSEKTEDLLELEDCEEDEEC